MQRLLSVLTMCMLLLFSPLVGTMDAYGESELSEESDAMETSGRQSQYTCADYNGQGGPLWQGNPVLQGEIYEYPAASGTYWIAEGDEDWSPGNELAPGDDPDIWVLSCDCEEIWDAAGQPYWDSQTTYGQYDIIVHVTGPNAADNNTWISLGNSNTNNEPGQSNSWQLCAQDCDEFGGFGGMIWYSGMNINDGDIVEWPAMSGQYWIADNSASPSTQAPGLYSGSIWKMTCSCAEIWADNGGGIWDNSDTYGYLEIVSHNGYYWVSQMHQPPTNTNFEPGVTGWRWELCAATCGANDGWGSLGGPDWDSTQSYGANSTVMYPPGSGIFYHVPIGGPGVSVSTVPANSAGVANQGWVGPCTCEEIWFQGQANPTWNAVDPSVSQFVWDSTVTYPQWLLVMDSQGTIWISLVNNNIGDMPSEDSAFWAKCEGDCATDGGTVGAPFSSSQVYSGGDIAEFPSNSGLFYTFNSTGTSLAAAPMTPNGPNPKWSGPCDCSDIWMQSGMEIWDSQASYDLWQLVQDSNGRIWYSIVNSNIGNVPHTAPSEWEECGFSCSKLRIVGPVWDASANVQPNSVYEYPANSGFFYMALTYAGTNAPAPDSDPTVWEGGCRCGNIGDNSVSWSSAVSYDKFELVWSAAGSYPGFWISLIPNNVGNNPSISPDEWRKCGWNCNDFNGNTGPAFVSGSTTVTFGEIYEFPAYSGSFYLVWGGQAGVPIQNADDPDTNPDIWSPSCDCEMIWSAPANSPSPMFDSSVAYDQWEVVGTSSATGGIDLWTSEVPNNLGNTPSHLSLAWDACGEHCDRFDGYGGPVYVPSQTVNPGDTYEHPANSGIFYMVINSNSVANSPDPGTSPDIWSDPCDCESIWQDSVDPPNSPPVWTAGSFTSYNQWQIVEYNGYYWMATVNGVLNSAPSPLNSNWSICGEEIDPCTYAALTDNSWPSWLNPTWAGGSIGYMLNDQVAHGNELYISAVNNNMVAPSDASVASGMWVECDCSDLIDVSPEYVAGASYLAGDVVYSQGALWFAIDNTNSVAGSSDWRPCNWCDLSDGNVQAWDSWSGSLGNYQIGDTVAHNGVYYVSILDNNHNEPGVVMLWFGGVSPSNWQIQIQNWKTQGWVECECSEIAQDYQAGFSYNQGDVVVGPDDQIWVSMYSGNTWWPGFAINWWGTTWVISTWELCNPGTCLDPTVWTAPPGAVSGYQDGDAVTHVGTTWFLQPGNSGTAVPPDWSMVTTPGPWQLCTPVISWPWYMSPTINGSIGALKSEDTYQEMEAVGNDADSVKAILGSAQLAGESSDGAFLDIGEHLLVESTGIRENESFSIAYRTDVALTEMNEQDLELLIRNGVWIVATCEASYGLTAKSGGEMLCGMWQNDGTTVVISSASNSSSQLLRVRPGMLCPEGAMNCVDIVIEDMMGGEVAPEDDDDDGVPDAWDECSETSKGVATDANGCEVKAESAAEEGGGLPGFTLVLMMSAMFGAIVYTGRARREE